MKYSLKSTKYILHEYSLEFKIFELKHFFEYFNPNI